MKLRLLGAVLIAAGLTGPVGSSARAADAGVGTGQVPHEGTVDSGIRGTMVSAWGNPPANPPTYQCVRVFDATEKLLVAYGTCSGTSGEFRVPLPAEVYIVDAGGRRRPHARRPRTVTQRNTIAIGS